MNDLLIEFLTEELPPLNLEKTFGQVFSTYLMDEINGFKTENIQVRYFVTPRRFGVVITNLKAQEETQKINKKGPAINSGLKDSAPTNALLGFMKSVSVSDYNDLEQRSDGYFYYEVEKVGQHIEQVIPQALQNSLKKLPIAKHMRWADNDYSFVRPVHNLVIMYGDKVICANTEILGLKAVNYTYGHRIMSAGTISIQSASSYADQLEKEGFVIAEFSKRRSLIDSTLQQQAKSYGLNLASNGLIDLLDEVTALVEYPVVLMGEFASEFLQVPQECLILSMVKNQKYFALLDATGKLSNKFLFVANIKAADPSIIIAGNQKVLSARLEDAKFFFEQDKKHGLDIFLSRLKNVVYHNKLGTQQERLDRLKAIALTSNRLGFNLSEDDISITVSWLKADLMSEMVGEFPELQGIMGKYYALNAGVASEIANAIEKHYYPRFSSDELPDTPLATLMSLSDKLDLLVGIWGIGLIPTGEKDPFALRRAALGIVRILLQNNLDILELLLIAYKQFENIRGFNKENTVMASGAQSLPKVVVEIYSFILERLFNYLTNEMKFSSNVVKAVLASNNFSTTVHNKKYFEKLPLLLSTLTIFAASSSNQEFFQANKRIANILKKNAESIKTILALNEINQYLQIEAEKDLLNFIISFDTSNINENSWNIYLAKLEQCSPILARFFADVMVMADDLTLRSARLSLLYHLEQKVNLLCNMATLGSGDN